MLLFSCLYILADIFLNKSKAKLIWLFRLGVLSMAIFYILNASTAPIWMLFVSWWLLYAAHGIKHSQNLALLLAHWPFVWASSLQDWFALIFKAKFVQSIKSGIKKTGIWLFPLLAVLAFFLLYLAGSEFVAHSTQSVVNTFFNALDAFFKKLALGKIESVWFGLFVLGLLLTTSLMASVYKSIWPSWDNYSYSQQEEIVPFNAAMQKSMLFFLVAINLLLAWVVWLEIKNIWFGFSWQGELLKGFVHQGTYALIVSIFLAVTALAFIFNKVFQQSEGASNKSIKQLAYVWITLNILMVISVCIRNYWYIHFFGLAYKRIGLFFFLAICFLSLLVVFWMINKKYHPQFLIKVVAIGAYILLLFMAMFNWDKHIANYNINQYNEAYLYAPLLLELDDKVLPILNLPQNKIDEIETVQIQLFPFVIAYEMSNLGYASKIEKRIIAFKEEHQKQHWLSKTWADQKAYKALFKQN